MKRKSTTKSSVRGILHRYFKRQEGQSASGFLEEIKALTNDEQLELAQDAVREMDMTESEVQFSFK